MTEHGLIFGAWSIRKFLEKIKWQTRRIPSKGNCLVDGRSGKYLRELWPFLKFRDERVYADSGPSPIGNAGPYLHVPESDLSPWTPGAIHRIYPKVQVGDLIWAREAFWKLGPNFYNKELEFESNNNNIAYCATDKEPTKGHLKSSPLFMRREFSRLSFNVSKVRIERIQEITEDDAKAEGAERYDPTAHSGCMPSDAETVEDGEEYRAGFAEGWNAINAERGYSWGDNDWIFAYDLELIECPT